MNHFLRSMRRALIVTGSIAALFPTSAGAVKPRTEIASGDTVWVGHVHSPTGLPGVPGGYGPYHVGRGPSRPGVDTNGMWEFDTDPDTLMGWWPIRQAYTLTGGQVRTDNNRPWFALDYGNSGNQRGRAPGGRTFGVVGYWHRDGGNTVVQPGGSPPPPNWTPLTIGGSGSFSAWMGLRAHGDVTTKETASNNPFNEDLLQYNGVNATSPSGNDKAFPGYGSQMDQMLYRDYQVSDLNADLTVSFDYQAEMSTAVDTAAATRTGWFDADPLAAVSGPSVPTSQLNNFISSSLAGAAAPSDSFMVYIGAGVQTSDQVTYSDGLVRFLYDSRYRWFDEVLFWDRDPASPPSNPQPLYYRQLLSVAGSRAAQRVQFVVPRSVLQRIYARSTNRIRLVFRVKTNRGFDDEGPGYSSNGRGAAIVDNVTLKESSSPTTLVFGNFESASSIDNSTFVSPLSAWKSTGKPPAIYFHGHPLDALLYDPENPAACQLSGNVVSAGDHDQSEAAGGFVSGTAERERMDGMVSPTINLVSTGPGNYNGMGIDSQIAAATDDIFLRYDLYAGVFDTPNDGNTWSIGVQCYPGNSKTAWNGTTYPAWGQIRMPATPFSHAQQGCLTDLRGLRAMGLIRTSNPNGIPDSIRVFLGKQQQCFAFNVTTQCSSTDGAYFDNVSVGFRNAPTSFKFPPAGCDSFPTTLSLVFDVPGYGPTMIEASGEIRVARSDPHICPTDGRERIDTEMIDGRMAGNVPGLGRVEVLIGSYNGLDPTFGYVRATDNPNLAESFFTVKPKFVFESSGSPLGVCVDGLAMQAVIGSIPPPCNTVYEPPPDPPEFHFRDCCTGEEVTVLGTVTKSQHMVCGSGTPDIPEEHQVCMHIDIAGSSSPGVTKLKVVKGGHCDTVVVNTGAIALSGGESSSTIASRVATAFANALANHDCDCKVSVAGSRVDVCCDVHFGSLSVCLEGTDVPAPGTLLGSASNRGQNYSAVTDTSDLKIRKCDLSPGLPVCGVAAVGDHPPAPVAGEPVLVLSPNPFDPEVTIRFTTSREGHVRLEIHDTQGRLVEKIVDEWQAAGPHQARWSRIGAGGTGLRPGFYLIRLTSPDGVKTRKAINLR